MPYPFTLPTTSSVSLRDFFDSRSHPGLPLTATSKRNVVKDALKRYKRLPAKDQASSLSSIHDAITDYLPYLLTLSAGSSYREIYQESISVTIKKPIEAAWRTTISATIPGRESARPTLVGLHQEVSFVLSTLAYVQFLIARSYLRTLYDASSLSSEKRVSTISAAMKCLLEAHAIYRYLLSLPVVSAATEAPPDIQSSTLSGLAALALAEATLAVIAKDDPYATAVAEDRSKDSNEWMYKAPTIPKPRASLYIRICLAAAEHARQAQALLSRNPAGKIQDDLLQYVDDLQRTAKAKAIRFSAINSEMVGQTGEALAWLNAAKRELGLTSELDDGKRKGFRGLKQTWLERREDRKVEKGGEWGLDAGRLEEARILEMLETKWDKENSTINVQIVPPFEPLLRQLPSGREYHDPKPWSPPTLDATELANMRGLPDPADTFQGLEEDSGGEDQYASPDIGPVGAFPGSHDQYGRKSAGNAYF